MSSLWKLKGDDNDDMTNEWCRVYKEFDATVNNISKVKPNSELVSKDSWYRSSEMTDKEVEFSQPMLVQLMEWKLTIGKRRPALLSYVKALSDKAVKAAAAEGFKLAAEGRVRGAIEALSKPLRGVGPATASAILAARFPETFAFMSDEALEAVAHIIGKREYSLPHYLRFQAAMAEKAVELNAAASASNNDWTADKVQWTLWTQGSIDKLRANKKGTKRKAAK